MRDTHVTEVEHMSSSSSDDDDGDVSGNVVASSASATSAATAPPHTVGIFPNHVHRDHPTYLIFASRADKERWLYHLTVVSGGDPGQGTQFEQLVQQLMEADGDPKSSVWRHPLMTHASHPIAHPLTTFTSEHLQTEAVKLFKVRVRERVKLL